MLGRASDTDGSFAGSADEFRISNRVLTPSEFLRQPVNNFANWIAGYSLTDSSFDGDDDGDGLDNGVEAFFGTHPGVSNSGLTEISMGTDTVTFRHPNPDTPLNDVSGSYEWSPDLVNWFAADGAAGDGSTTVNAVATPDSPAANVTTVEATIGGTVPNRIFLRAAATTP